jgi:hypothetical protein
MRKDETESQALYGMNSTKSAADLITFEKDTSHGNVAGKISIS